MRSLFGTVVALILVAAMPANAIPKGIDLVQDCRDGADAVERARCEAYVSGFISGSQASYNGRFFNQWRYGDSKWCVEETVSDAEIIAAFEKYAKEHTSELHFPAPTLLGKALSVTYPCR